MTEKTKDRVEALISKFGYYIAMEVAEELYNRDVDWVEKLSKDYPEDWQLSDVDKSRKLFDELKDYITKQTQL